MFATCASFGTRLLAPDVQVSALVTRADCSSVAKKSIKTLKLKLMNFVIRPGPAGERAFSTFIPGGFERWQLVTL
jgi:hypothetical protein